MDYADGWAAVNRLIRQGQSWSGREMNCAYWNAGDGTYVDVSNTLGLASPGDGRAYARVDWDGDGDLDLWLANRTAPQIQFLRNDSGASSYLSLELQGRGANTAAIGARVMLRSSEGRILMREQRVGSGYLSQSSRWMHFGLGKKRRVEGLRVFWPDGETEEFSGAEAGGRFVLKQGSGSATPAPAPRRSIALAPSTPEPRKVEASARIAITKGLDLPELEAQSFDGQSLSTRNGQATLVNFWASWCPNCIGELRSWSAAKETLEEAGLRVIALSVDEDEESATDTWSALSPPFQAGLAPASWIAIFDVLQRLSIDKQREMAVPTSFLLDAEGRIAFIYRGPVEADVIARDVASLEQPAAAFAGLPFEGRSLGEAKPIPLFDIIRRLLDQERPEEAHFYLEVAGRQMGPPESQPADGPRLSDSLTRTGMYFLSERQFDEAQRAFDEAIAYTPSDPLAWFGRARLRAAQSNPKGAEEDLTEALRHDDAFAPAWDLMGTVRFLQQNLAGARAALERATELDASLASSWSTLGIVELSSSQFERGVRAFGMATRLTPNSADAWTGLGICQLQLGRQKEGVQSLEKALGIDPENARALQVMKQLGLR